MLFSFLILLPLVLVNAWKEVLNFVQKSSQPLKAGLDNTQVYEAFRKLPELDDKILVQLLQERYEKYWKGICKRWSMLSMGIEIFLPIKKRNNGLLEKRDYPPTLMRMFFTREVWAAILMRRVSLKDVMRLWPREQHLHVKLALKLYFRIQITVRLYPEHLLRAYLVKCLQSGSGLIRELALMSEMTENGYQIGMQQWEEQTEYVFVLISVNYMCLQYYKMLLMAADYPSDVMESLDRISAKYEKSFLL